MSGRFGIIPAALFDENLSPQEIALVCLLSTYADKSGYCWPSYETLAMKLSRSKGWVSQTMTNLVEKGIIKTSKRGGQKYGFTILYDRTVQPAKHTVQPAKQNSIKNNNIDRGTPTLISINFAPTSAMKQYLLTKRPDLDPVKFQNDFITRCQAKGYRYARWDKAWENFVNNEPKARSNGKNNSKPSLDDIRSACEAAERLANVNLTEEEIFDNEEAHH